MRPLYLILCLMLAALMLAGCSKPWTNPQYGENKAVQDYHFDKDSTDCSVMASEKYPVDKRQQRVLYGTCMEEKGWKESRQGDGYYFNTK